MTRPTTRDMKGQWKQHVGAAKVAWSKLTEDEILKSEGREEKLVGLVEQHYAISHKEAKKQVQDFLSERIH